MPRFVILSHDWPFPHYDLMLESGDSLRTWRLSEPPQEEPVAAEPLENHRLDFLDYEGPLGGERGSVTRWDSGTFEWECNTPEMARVRVMGLRIEGNLELEKLARGSTPTSPAWIGGDWGGANRETDWICHLVQKHSD
jgi:hypothetical protein